MSVFCSIIIPAFNAEKYIAQCIRSVLSQTDKDCEILVINDGSLDNTKSILQSLSERHPSISVTDIPHSGAGAARNAGLKRACGKYVIFLDADDYWTNPHLLEHLRVRLSCQQTDLVMFQMDKCTEKWGDSEEIQKGALPFR